MELPFEHAPSDDGARSKKLRSFFSPSSKGFPPSSTPKSFSSDIKQVQRKTETPISNEMESPVTAVQTPETTSNSNPRSYDHSLSVYSPKSEVHSDGSGSQSSLVDLNVLVAQGDPVSLRMMDEKLSRWGHTVDIASDGQECYDRFEANPSKVDVILMDLKVCISCHIHIATGNGF